MSDQAQSTRRHFVKIIGAVGATVVYMEGAPDWPPDRLWRQPEPRREVVCDRDHELVHGPAAPLGPAPGPSVPYRAVSLITRSRCAKYVICRGLYGSQATLHLDLDSRLTVPQVSRRT